jgi:hypothetical protein
MVKKIIVFILVAFAIYAVITSPEKAADIVKTIWDLIWSAILSIADFFDALLRG